MFYLLFGLALFIAIMGSIICTYFLVVCVLFLINKYLNKDNIKFRNYIKYW